MFSYSKLFFQIKLAKSIFFTYFWRAKYIIMETLIGRKEEQVILKEALASNEAEMVAIVGRRRVGKTFLINTVYKEQIVFKVTGVQNVSLEKQLANFREVLEEYMGNAPPLLKDWFEAFSHLKKYLKSQLGKSKKVIFIDEIPWIATIKSDFLSALGYFWNSWASLQNLVVVICGSATSWIIQKVVFDTGGLHNRITRYIQLAPFNLAETEAYLKNRRLNFTRYQIVELYMAMGGVPHYLKEIKGGKSAIQNIDDICFSKTGLLRQEFLKLYPALFRRPDNHIAIIRALASKRQGMSRNEIIKAAKTPHGGATSKTLEELEQSGFVSFYYPFGKKKKEKLYRLSDEYSLFYLHFMEDKTNEGQGTWQYLSQRQAYKTWSGYAYEGVCLKHIPQIKKALGISGVYSKSASFFKKGTQEEKGAQIDLLIDRNDQVINIIEVKFYNKEFTITKEYAKRLQQKKWVFEETTKTRKLSMLTLITTFGLKHNQHSLGLIEQVLSLDDLFL